MNVKLLNNKEEIVTAYVLQGKSLREIADFYSVSSGSIRSVLKKADVTLRKRGRRASGTVVTTVEVPETGTVEV